jgi:hypothetical protein
VGSEFSTIVTHMISTINIHSVGNITFFFLSSDLIMRIVNLLSVSCAPIITNVEMWQRGGGGEC